MQTNYEIALNQFMPAFRARVAKLMISKYNISQQKAAEFLEVTQASISKYVNEHYSKVIKEAESEISDEMVEGFVKEIVENQERSAQKVMCSACQKYHAFDCSIMIK